MNLEVLHVGPLGTNCYIVWDENRSCAVVDCGGQAEKVAEFIPTATATILAAWRAF